MKTMSVISAIALMSGTAMAEIKMVQLARFLANMHHLVSNYLGAPKLLLPT